MSWILLLASAFAVTPEAMLAAPSADRLAASTTELLAYAQDPAWRVRTRANAALAWQTDAGIADRITKVGPITTRTGAIRYTDRVLGTPVAAPLLIERLLASPDAEDRAALAAALPQTGGDWSEAAAGLLTSETEPVVRVQLTEALREATAAPAWIGLAAAAIDPSPEVRAAAFRASGARPDGADHAALVLAGLDDADARVRAAAVRAVGWLGVSDGWGGTVALLSDVDADVRLQAVHTLVRLDPARARVLPAMSALRGDADTRVARAVSRL